MGLQSKKPKLKKELSLFQVTIYGVGLILGAGIYTVIGEAAGLTGNSLPIAFLLSAFLAALTGLSYAELSSMYPKEEGEYLYVRKAFDRKIFRDTTALLRIFVGVVSTGAVALAFSGYISSFVSTPILPVALMIIAVCSFVNYFGIDFSAKMNLLFTGIEVLGLLIIIWLGLGSWNPGQLFELPYGFKGLIGSSFLLFFAYIGFGSIVNISEETHNAEKSIPRAILLSIFFTTIIYALVAFSATSAVNWQSLAQSSYPLSLVAQTAWGASAFKLISIIAVFSTTNTVLIQLISTSRLLYGVSKKKYKLFPKSFSKIHSKRKTPYVSIAVIGVLALLFTFISDIGIVAGLSNMFLFLIFILVNLSLLKLRFKRPDQRRPFKSPLNIGKFSITAFLGLLISVIFIIFYIFRSFL